MKPVSDAILDVPAMESIRLSLCLDVLLSGGDGKMRAIGVAQVGEQCRARRGAGFQGRGRTL